MRLSITAPNLPALIDHWRQAPALTLQALQGAVEEADLFLQRETIERTPIGVGGGGGLRGSIFTEERRLSDGVVGLVASTALHAEPVEMGTEPHFPPPHALEDWVRQKLGVEEKRVSGVAFLIARKISRKGTKGAFMFRNALQAARPAVDRIFGEHAQRLAQRLATP